MESSQIAHITFDLSNAMHAREQMQRMQFKCGSFQPHSFFSPTIVIRTHFDVFWRVNTLRNKIALPFQESNTTHLLCL
uniref:Ovule protein n=1 Tax=Steinernema glaseri TaxID=37863 RepID=A0A1I7Y3Y6_9BILA